ncbi:carboxymuconolactone decarboxylase family protein [Methylocaldum gracile]|jgi:uncharacterized peroxidase-related enzyme|uniref:carboxymuconolactone decarboxylase family protein n=1 Tax=unclassified Methylocaldum TaxID=2622260 RepID=UPI00105E324D
MTTQNAIDPAAALAEIEQTFGFIPNLFRAYADYPPLLGANWAKVKAILLQGGLRREVKETIALLVSKDNACAYCIDAHAAALHMLGFSPQDVAAMEHTLGDTHFSSREQALIDFARRANREANRMAADLKRLSAQDIPMAEVIEALGVMELFAAFNRFADALGVVPDSFPSPQQ